MKSLKHEAAKNLAIYSFDEAIDLYKIWEQVYQQRWFILLMSLAGLIIAGLYLLSLEPQYQSNALIKINPSDNNIMNKIGSKDDIATLAILSSLGPPKNAELELIRTNYILQPIVEKYSLNVRLTPHYFPILGAWLARKYQQEGIAKPFLGLNSYAWGGEQVRLKHFFLPQKYDEQTFKLVTLPGSKYNLYSSRGQLLLTGATGKVAHSNLFQGLRLEIDKLLARPGTEFFVHYQSPLAVTKQLANRLAIESVVGTPSSSNPLILTDVLQLKLLGPDPGNLVQSLNAIVEYTVTKNARRKALEAEKTLAFLQQRLIEVRTGLDQAEQHLSLSRAKSGIVEGTKANDFLIQELLHTEESLETIKGQKEDALQIYTSQHPLVITAEKQEARLKNRANELKRQIKNIPLTAQRDLNLEREVKIKNALYVSLLSSMQQLEIIKAGIIGDISPLLSASTPVLISSKKNMILLGGFTIGLFLSMVVVMIKPAWRQMISHPDQLEDELNIPIQAIVTFSKKQKQLERFYQKVKYAHSNALPYPLILAKHAPYDNAIESLRSLLVGLDIKYPTSRPVIALMSSLGGVGKSFIAINLAQVIADSGKKTLLIDADLRKSQFHKIFTQGKAKGLSEYLEGTGEYQPLIKTIDKNLFLLPCGKVATHPSEILQKQRFRDLLESAKHDFDFIIIDTPPILAVIDPIIIARSCDIKFFIVNGSAEYLSNVTQAMKKAKNHEIEIDAFILTHKKSTAPYGELFYHNYRYAQDLPISTKDSY